MHTVAVLWAVAQLLEPGSAFPSLREKSLADTVVTLPDDARGKVAVVGFGFSQASGAPLRALMTMVDRDFGDRVLIFQVASIESAPSFVRGMIRSGMRKDVPSKMLPRFVAATKEDKLWRARFGVNDDKRAYLAVLDREGRLRARISGAAEQYSQLRQVLVEELR